MGKVCFILFIVNNDSHACGGVCIVSYFIIMAVNVFDWPFNSLSGYTIVATLRVEWSVRLYDSCNCMRRVIFKIKCCCTTMVLFSWKIIFLKVNQRTSMEDGWSWFGWPVCNLKCSVLGRRDPTLPRFWIKCIYCISHVLGRVCVCVHACV